MLSESKKRRARYVLFADGLANSSHRGVIAMYISEFLLSEEL